MNGTAFKMSTNLGQIEAAWRWIATLTPKYKREKNQIGLMKAFPKANITKKENSSPN